ncbi:MAG: MoxR family ATPase [Spirochaetales bacterium]|nr:MoxR family ATPase [Spirochaetales bacterium]
MNDRIKKCTGIIAGIRDNITSYFIGKRKQIDLMLTGFISGLHVLVSDIPGVGKTTMAKCLAASTGLSFARIQFTPDLLPGDIVGMNVWDTQKKEFIYKQGAIMSQFVLADEINRASPRTQSSLLEAMQDMTVSIDGKTHMLPRPFFVIATQNPVTFTGTFPLPEAELDRFGLSFSLGYASNSEEIDILGMKKSIGPFDALKPVTNPGEIVEIRHLVEEIHVSNEIKEYIIGLANRIRSSHYVKLGISPRSLQHLVAASQALALSREREFVIPEDVTELAIPVLAHRIILSTEAHMERKSEADILSDFLATMPVPAGR